MRLMPRSIVGQFVAGTVLIQAVVFAAFLSLSVRQQFRETQQRDSQRLRQQAELIAGLLADPLARNEPGLLDTVVRSVDITTTVRELMLTDASGNMLRVSRKSFDTVLDAQERSILPQVVASRGYQTLQVAHGNVEGVQPVVVGGAVRGIVWITQDTVLALRSPISLLKTVLGYACFALLGNLLLVWVLSSTVAMPLRQLRRATQQVRNDPNDLSSFPLAIAAHNEAGELTASFNAMVDEISAQRRGTQQTLKLLDSLLSGAPIGFGFYDRQHRYVRLNEHLAQLHGFPMEEHIGKRLRDLLPPGAPMDVAQQTEALIDRVFNEDVSFSEMEITGVLPGDHRVRTWQTSYFPVHLSEGGVRWVGVIATEITQRKQAEESMRRSEKLAGAGRLAASIAHEISNPLESVTNLLYLLRLHASLDDEAQRYAEMAQSELMRVAEIAQQTLRFYRQTSYPSDVHMTDMLRSILVLHHARTQTPRVDVRLRFADNAVLFGFAGELRQMFANLVGNALDAMPNGGTLHLRLRETRRAGLRGLRFTVADNGIGMSEEVRRRIFEPFFTTKDHTGTGLGLWATEEIIEKHRGSVRVRSHEARFPGDASGSVFTIFFPLDGVPRGPRIVVNAAQALADHVI